MPVDPLMEEQARLALNATKTLHRRLAEIQCQPQEQAELRALARSANKAVQAMQKLARDEAVRADVRHDILREAVRDELIDREANAARVLDRQRMLAEAQHDGARVLDRSLASARNIENALGALCPYQMRVAPGVAVLANEDAR